jgi:heme/copper-type cytochrome/quinol oxidase subunit 2
LLLLPFTLMALMVGLRGAGSSVAEQDASAREVREFQMTAKKYEFTPSVITARQGETVRLIITATDRDHGFELAAFGIKQKLIKGSPTTIEFVVDKPGTFSFKCSEFCGLGHRRMKGTLLVRE